MIVNRLLNFYSVFVIYYSYTIFTYFFFQAEDGIRDTSVTGVQTCALPISLNSQLSTLNRGLLLLVLLLQLGCQRSGAQIGRASCRERVLMLDEDVCL